MSDPGNFKSRASPDGLGNPRRSSKEAPLLAEASAPRLVTSTWNPRASGCGTGGQPVKREWHDPCLHTSPSFLPSVAPEQSVLGIAARAGGSRPRGGRRNGRLDDHQRQNRAAHDAGLERDRDRRRHRGGPRHPARLGRHRRREAARPCGRRDAPWRDRSAEPAPGRPSTPWRSPTSTSRSRSRSACRRPRRRWAPRSRSPRSPPVWSCSAARPWSWAMRSRRSRPPMRWPASNGSPARSRRRCAGRERTDAEARSGRHPGNPYKASGKS